MEQTPEFPQKYEGFSNTHEENIDTIAKLENIKNPEILQLYKMMSNLVEKLKPAIENHEYDFLIGEDASGRIPALILKKILDTVYKKQGIIPAKMLFLAGARHFIDQEDIIENFANHIDKHAPEKVSKTLIITEYIDTGSSVAVTIQALQKNNIAYDIATCSVDQWSFENHLRPEIKNHLYYGDFAGAPKITGESNLSGVKKNSGDILSTRNNSNKDLLRSARKDTDFLAQILLHEIFYDNETLISKTE